jgi:hypothetical protein
MRQLASFREHTADTAEAAEEWHRHEDAIQFLLGTTDGDIPVYISDKAFYVYGAVAPMNLIEAESIDKLLDWQLIPSSGFGILTTWANGDTETGVHPPLYSTGSEALDAGEPVYFYRTFEGVDDAPRIEINQRFAHIMGLHYMPSRQSWCDMDEMGDIIPKAVITERYQDRGSSICCTLRQDALDMLLFVTKSCLVRVFDVIRFSGQYPNYRTPVTTDVYSNDTFHLYTRRHVYRTDGVAHSSLLRGYQVIYCSHSQREMESLILEEPPREYASFIIQDWKNERVVEWTSAPEQIGNYFVESEYPFQTSPAYFKPDVLAQYRQNPSKFVIDDRRLTCKGAWDIPYDINDEGLVVAYISDLSNLPYKEQLRWKAFNVAPVGEISERAYKTDFLGLWDETYEPLSSLKHILIHFPQYDEQGMPSMVWRMPPSPETRDINFLGHVVTDSRKEWEDQILTLGQILVEGLNKQFLKTVASRLGCLDPQLGSIKLIDAILEKLGVPPSEREEIISPIGHVHSLRSSLVAHVGGALPEGDLRDHFRQLLEKCDKAMRELADIVKNGAFTTWGIEGATTHEAKEE